jgi:predicted nucleic acid-binding protein
VLNAFINDIKADLFRLDFATTDIARAQELANKYQNLPLGLTGALVIACAERNGEMLSLNEHFWIVSGEGKLKMHTLE